jgi:hypothetical protein
MVRGVGKKETAAFTAPSRREVNGHGRSGSGVEAARGLGAPARGRARGGARHRGWGLRDRVRGRKSLPWRRRRLDGGGRGRLLVNGPLVGRLGLVFRKLFFYLFQNVNKYILKIILIHNNYDKIIYYKKYLFLDQ